jgi:hypothetical protein
VVVKETRKPRGGGSAERCIQYILAEEFSAKVVHGRENDPIHAAQMAGLSQIMAEANARPDLGTNVIWSPAAGDGRRPSSIYARGVTSLYTAAMEIGAIAAAQPNTKGPVTHLIYSCDAEQSKTVTDETLIRAAEYALDQSGYRDHAAILAVHRDSPNGYVHVHCAVSTINSRTLLAAPRIDNYARLHRGARLAELKFDLKDDHGMYVIRDRGLATERIERVNKDDWAAWHRERVQDRAESLMRSHGFVSDNIGLETTRDRADRITHAIRQYLAQCHDRVDVDHPTGEKALYSDLHVTLWGLACTFEGVQDGKLMVRLMERPKDAVAAQVWTDAAGEQHERLARWVPTDTVIKLDPNRIARSPLDGWKSQKTPSPLLQASHARALEDRQWLLGVGTAAEAEAQYKEVIAHDPGRMSRDHVYGCGEATMTGDDFDAMASMHITDDPQAWSDRVQREDQTLRVLSLKTQSPLYTIENQLTVSLRVKERIERGVTADYEGFRRDLLDQAIEIVAAEERAKPGSAFERFSDEQMRVFDALSKQIVVIQGDAGTGKTLLGKTFRVYTELCERPVRGFTTAARAADELALKSGIQSVNSTRALFEETPNNPAIPDQAGVIGDEFSMWSVEAADAYLDRGERAGAQMILQGDGAQLPNIGAGNTFGIACRVAADAGLLVRMTETRRQTGESVRWMADSSIGIAKAGAAIRKRQNAAFWACVEQYESHGHLRYCTEDVRDGEVIPARVVEIESIANAIVGAMNDGVRVIAPGRVYQDCLYINRFVRRELGLEGKGQEFDLDRGYMEFSVGDRILFRQNRKTHNDIVVRNGDTATVTHLEQIGADWFVTADLDKGVTARWNAADWRQIEYGYASSIHANQGGQAPMVIGSITKSDDARSFHVTVSRTEDILMLFTSMPRTEMFKQLTSDKSMNPKDDALLFGIVEAQTGGKDTAWAKNVRRDAEHEKSPLRQQHYAYVARTMAARNARIVNILGDSTITPIGRIKQLRALEDDLPLWPFYRYCVEERSRLEAEWDALERTRAHEPKRLTPAEMLARDREAAAAENLLFEQEKRDRGYRKEQERHDRNLAAARGGLVPLTGTLGAEYAAKRGLTGLDDVFYAPNWPEGVETNAGKISAGHGPAIVFSGYDAAGNVTALQGRYIDPPDWLAKVYTVGPAKQSLMISGPDVWTAPIVRISEGGPDVKTDIGVPAFGLMGTNNVPDDLEQRINGRPTIIATDNDIAGNDCAIALNARLTGKTTRLELRPGEDVNDAFLHRGGDLLHAVDRSIAALTGREIERSRGMRR